MKNEEHLHGSHLCLSSLLLPTVSFAGMRRQRLLLQYYFLFIQLHLTKILRYIIFLIMQCQKRRRHLSKIVFEVIMKCSAGRAINNKTILCKARVASVIAGNYVNETNNSSVNFRKFPGADRTEYFVPKLYH